MVVGWFGVAEALGSVVAVVVEYEGPWKFPGASECMLGSASSTLSRLKRLSPLRSAAGVFCGAESSCEVSVKVPARLAMRGLVTSA